MVTFNSEALFASGTSRFRIGPVKLRHAVQHPPGSKGARVDAQGVESRQIIQTGVLVADDPVSLKSLSEAIRQKMDGRAYTLVDNLGRAWTEVVMLHFETQEAVRVGARWKTAYRVEYLQVIP